MTDVTGSMFISYRRSPARPSGDAEARLVRNALRDRGVPTWRDRDDLNPIPTEEDLIATLDSEEIAGAVLLVSPETETSSIIREVEAPAILDRFQRRDGFLVKPVLINLAYRDVDSVLGRPGAFQKVEYFDIHRIARGSLEEEDARLIANAVLKQRLAAVRQRAPDRAVALGLYSRRAASGLGIALRHDFARYFTDREAAPGAYARIETALFDAATALTATGDRIPVVAHGNAALPLGILFGAVYSRFVFDLAWKQVGPRATEKSWSLKSAVGDIATAVSDVKGDPSSEDLVLAISVNADVDRAAAEYLEATGFSPRAMISVGLAGGSLQQGQTVSPQEGLKIAHDAINAARNLKDRLRMKRANLHVFLACPLGLAILIGQSLNTFGECVVYEHLSDRTPSYQRVHRFKPSNFTYHAS